MKDNVKIRLSTYDDKKYLVKWLNDDEILKYFPMCDEREVEDAASYWISFVANGAVLTAEIDNVPVGIATLYLHPYKKLAHQSLFPIIVDKNHRGKGVGSKILIEMIKLAKEKFKIKLLHLEVYEGNPAITLYERFGFKKYGFHKNFLKEKTGGYVGKILMQKVL